MDIHARLAKNGEEIAALIGLILALCFLGVAGWTGDTRYDAFGSICIGGVLIVVSVFVAIRIKGLLIGRSAEPELRARIDSIIEADPDIEQLLNAITVHVGPKIMLAAKIRMRGTLTIDEAVERINALEVALKRAVPELGWCFMEPDTRD